MAYFSSSSLCKICSRVCDRSSCRATSCIFRYELLNLFPYIARCVCIRSVVLESVFSKMTGICHKGYPMWDIKCGISHMGYRIWDIPYGYPIQPEYICVYIYIYMGQGAGTAGPPMGSGPPKSDGAGLRKPLMYAPVL